MSHYAALPVAYRTCRHEAGASSSYPATDCPLCGGTGFEPIRWTVQLLPDGTQVGSHGTRSVAEAAARQLNARL